MKWTIPDQEQTREEVERGGAKRTSSM